MLVTLSGIVTLVRVSQPLNKASLIVVNDLGSFIFFKFVHSENALLPIEVTVSGIVIDSRL